MEKQSKKVLLTGIALLSAFGVFAQGNGNAGIQEATQMVTGYFDPATKLIYAIGAVVGLIGGSDLPMKRGIITNRNKFILGPSGSGKSFSLTTWCGNTTNRAHTSCSWTRVIPIRAYAN